MKPEARHEDAATSDAQALHRELRDRIVLMTYPPGSFLSENRLAREFGLSRTPVRRALHRLDFDGLVNIERGVGTMVVPLDTFYLSQVYTLRLKLTELIGELAPAVVDDAELGTLWRLRDDAAAAGEARDAEGLARVYLRFHEAVLQAIGHEPLREIADRLFFQTARVWVGALPHLTWDEEVAIMSEEMEATARALEAGDMEAVARVRRAHLIGCIRRVNDHLGTFELEPAGRDGTAGREDETGKDPT